MVGVGELLASAVLKHVCGKLGSAIWQEIASQLKLSEDLEGLKSRLADIQVVLRKAEERSMKDDSVCVRMKELKVVSYDMEDMLMDFEDQISHNKDDSQRNTPITKVSIPWKLRMTIPHKLNNMKKKLEQIANLKIFDFTANISLDDLDMIQRSPTSYHVDEEAIVGRIEEKREMMKLLQKDCDHYIIPIYGIGGLGKTTLAQMVFNDKTTEQDFDIRLWVPVPTKCVIENIGRSIISQVDGQSKEFDFVSVQKRVEMILSAKRSLIVLDDIWEEKADNLERVRTMLKAGKPGSKIIITTRTEQIAKRMNADLPFKLAVLPYEDCWDLFRAKAFLTGRAEQQKVLLGKQIATKCQGVPLAVKLLGSRLRDQPLRKWEETVRSDLWEEERDPTSAIASTAVLPSLKISYYYMPYYLRPCFAYFAIFPKGFRMEKSELIQRWIALGFVANEDRAEDYLDELVAVSFLQAASAPLSISARYSNPPSALFHMHDLVHELARSVAGEETAILDASRGGSFHPKMDNCRYMLFSNLNGSAPECNIMPSKARAIHFKDCTGCKPSPDTFSKAKCLRVLDFADMRTVKLPKSMKSLRHLQVLNLSENTCLTSLRRSICISQKLHYLDLHGCSNLTELPEHIHELKGLIHLNLSECTSLRELPEHIHELKGLIHLNLSECTSLRELPSLFGELQNLSFLNLSSCSQLEELPHSFGHLTNLKHLNMSFCCQLKLSTVSFECMKMLLYLNLSGCSSLEAIPEFYGDNAGCLETLDLSNCAGLATLSESCARLRNLRCLNLSGCSSIQNILHFLSNFVNLEYLNLSGVSMEKNQSGVRRNDSEAPGTSTGDGSHDSGEELTLHGILKKMSRLVYLSVGGLTLFSEQGIDSDLLILPDFIVSERGTGDCSNIDLLQNILDSTHCELNIRCLENVKSPDEAKKVELGKRHRLGSLSLEWSPSDWQMPTELTENTMAVLENLKPHPDLQRLSIKGYDHVVFPLWITRINDSLPNLVKLVLSDLVLCNQLPSPLGNLPNLEELEICNMPLLKEVYLAPCRNLKRLSLARLSGVSLRFHEDHRCKALRTDVQQMELGHAEERQIQTIFEAQFSDSSEGKGKGSMFDEEVQCLPEVLQQSPSSFQAKAALPVLHYLEIQNCHNVKFYPGLPECEEYFINDSSVGHHVTSTGIQQRATCPSTPLCQSTMNIQGCSEDVIHWATGQNINIVELVIDGCKTRGQNFYEDKTDEIEELKIDLRHSIRKLKITKCMFRLYIPFQQEHEIEELEIDRLEDFLGDLSSNSTPNLEKLTLSSPDNIASVSEKWIARMSHISYIKIYKTVYFHVKPFHQHQSSHPSNFLLHRQNHDFAINELFIRNLENVESPEEVNHGELAGYDELHSLSLVWSSQDSSRTDDTAVLQRLQPPRKLEKLSIEGYQGTTTSCSWVRSISSLLPNLVTIELAYMDSVNLEFLQDSVNLEHLSISNCSGLTVLPETIRGCSSLKKLEIVECWNFSELPEWLGELTSLTSLTIHAAKLESLPQSIKCLTNLDILNLNKCNYKIRERCSLSGEDGHVHISEEGPNISILSDGISLLQKISSSQLIELSIKDLQALSIDEAGKLELVAKEHLLSLSLEWTDFDDARGEKDKAILEKLQCNHTLERLCIRNYAGHDFPRWMSSLPNLTKIELSGLRHGELHLDHLRNLEELHISSFHFSERTEHWHDSTINDILSKSSLLIQRTKPLKKLRRIVMSLVGNLEWKTPTSPSEDIFPSLEYLEMHCCRGIRFEPSIPRSARYVISGRKQKPWLCSDSFPSFKRVMGSATSASSSKMEIKYFQDCFSNSLGYLQQLNIAELTVDCCFDKSPLPGCIRDWKSLRKLEILNCEYIRTLPDWLGDITSLVELKVETYWMKDLPPSIQRLTALQTLILSQCTMKFEERYCESGEERIKIKHIADIQIYRRQ